MLPLKKSSSAPALVYLVYQKMSLSNVLLETVRRRGSMTKLFLVFLTFFLFTYISLLFSRYAIHGTDIGFLSASNPLTRIKNPDSSFSLNKELRVVEEGEEDDVRGRRSRLVSSSVRDFVGYESVSILMPAWEVLLIVSSEAPPLLKAPVGGGGGGGGLYCLFSNNATSEARYAGVLPFTNRTAFKCEMPNSTRRRRPYIQPVLTENPAVVVQSSSVQESQANKTELIRNTFFVYESLSTENDVILFVKGVNHRQGINRRPDEFRCVFEDGQKTTVKTAVTSSVQEVFRCHHPDLTAFGPNTKIKVSLEIATEKRAVPSVALYAPTTSTTAPARRTIANQEPKKLLCACTMVYNVAKYLREWVTYYSKLGVEKFILYDNDSDDNLTEIVNELNKDGFNVTTLLWLWPKTQEAGFSHNAVFSNDTCRWMMYMDVDEFVFAPSWINESQPSDKLLRSLYLNEKSPHVGQVSFRCNDFGPSDQLTHPVEGVTQGYTCHRWVAQQRHKSIVLLDAVDDSLVNVVHHFGLKRGFRMKQLGPESGVVNHYKYQAWPEFKAKFRRRVSAYVVDWRESLNPKSKDRTPGLGFEPVEPKGWPKMFCDIRDDRLKLLTRKWFGIGTETGSKMVWQQRRR